MNPREFFHAVANKITGTASSPSENAPEPSLNIVVCQDADVLREDMHTIARHLKSKGHDIRIKSVQDQEHLLKHLDRIHKKGSPVPDAFFLDVGGVGESAALEVIKWFDKNYPGKPLPMIHFMSLSLDMSITEAGRLHTCDSRVPTSFVDADEPRWLCSHLKEVPPECMPYSTTLRELLNKTFNLSFPLGRKEDEYYAKKIKHMLDVTNDRMLDAWQAKRIPAETVIERLRNYTSGLATALRSGFYAGEGSVESLRQEAQFYGSTGFPVKGRVVFSRQEAEKLSPVERPILVMQSYDPAVVPLLAKGILGGLIVTSPYMASHLKLLCETHMVSGLFGLIPAGKKTLSCDFNEQAQPELPPYFEGDTVEIAGQRLSSGQAVLMGLGGNGLTFNPPDSLQMKPVDVLSSLGDNKLREDLEGLRKMNRCFTAFFAEKGLPQHGVKANIDSVNGRLLDFIAGIGLVRTEQMVAINTDQMRALRAILLRDDSAAYGELFSAVRADYTKVFRKLFQGPVKIRLFDFVHQEILNKEEQQEFLRRHNKLDIHGGEALAAWPRLYREQVRTIFEALASVCGPSSPVLEIMMPAIKTEQDVLDIKKIIEEEARRNYIDPQQYSFGVMIETLQSCENIAQIIPHCDFISFGTNDLTQQFFDISRRDLKAHARFSEKNGFDPFKKMAPEILALIESVSEKGRRIKPKLKIDVCGAQAADPDTALALYKIGVDNVSVAPSLGNLYGLPVILNYRRYDGLQKDADPGVTYKGSSL